ncbi:hypothetical protein ACTXT7_006533 [Hymenolepis weldensis]
MEIIPWATINSEIENIAGLMTNVVPNNCEAVRTCMHPLIDKDDGDWRQDVEIGYPKSFVLAASYYQTIAYESFHDILIE